MDTRRGRVKWGLHGTRSATTMAYWQNPLKWNRLGAANRPRVFCASLADVFEDWQGPVIDSQHRRLFTINGNEWFTEAEYPDCRPLTIADLRRKLFETIDATPNLDFLLLTKRPENVRGMWPGVCHDTDMGGDGVTITAYRRNVHLLYSASDQPSLDAGIDHLLACRPLVPVLGLSLEPLVGPVDLDIGDALYERRDNNGNCWQYKGHLDHVIVGGESGPRARPCNIDWIRSIIRQCKTAGVPCFVKQLGSKPFMPGSGGERFDWPCGYVVKGGNTWLDLRHPKGGDPTEWPEDLRVQEFPEAVA